MDLTEYPVKLYNNKRMAERIQDEVLNDYPDKKGAKIIPPVITDVLADKIGGIKKPLDLADLEQKANSLRKGTMEDKSVYLVFRQQLIGYDCMPVDKKGKPYDLSLMYMPPHCNDKFLDTLCLDDFELLQKINCFCQEKNTDIYDNAKCFARCMSLMKAEHPTDYVTLYNYMISKKAIPKSQMLSRISLTKEQFAFLVHYDKALADEEKREPLFPKIIDYATKNLQGQGTMDEINKTIATMRYGSIEEQETYNDFCEIVLGLPMVMPEHPTVQEQREKLLAKAERKAEAKLEQKV